MIHYQEVDIGTRNSQHLIFHEQFVSRFRDQDQWIEYAFLAIIISFNMHKSGGRIRDHEECPDACTTIR